MSRIIGFKLSENHKRKIAEALKGNKNGIGHVISLEHKENLRKIHKGKSLSQETKQKISKANKGKKKPVRSKEHCDKLSLMQLNKVKEGKHNFYKGGITKGNKFIRTSREYKLWRKAVFERDRWTCIFCGYRGSNIQADHIKRFSDYPELRFSIDNGRTLCYNCHKTTDTWGNYIKK